MKITRLFIFIFIFISAQLYAKEYTVENIPNVHLNDGRLFVSNPDGILSDKTVATLDQMLYQMQAENTAEIAVVAVESIGNKDIDIFATDLFSSWGIGKRSKDNGVLILFVLDQRKITFRTGYGVEGVLPDAICKRIQTRDMLPYFKKGDYDNGFINGVGTITKVLTTPGATEELTAVRENEEFSAISLISGYLTFSVIFSFIMLAFILTAKRRKKDHNPYEKYKALKTYKVFLLSASFIFPVFTLFLYWWVASSLKRLRNEPRKCEQCGAPMRKLNEEEDNFYLTPQENTEEKINSVDYDVWLCDKCGDTQVYPYENNMCGYTECPNCHTKAFSLQKDHIVRHATTLSQGMGEKIYYCEHCHKTIRKSYIIPIIIAASAAGRGNRGGGGFSGGFGGGMTGGGGSTSGW